MIFCVQTYVTICQILIYDGFPVRKVYDSFNSLPDITNLIFERANRGIWLRGISRKFIYLFSYSQVQHLQTSK